MIRDAGLMQHVATRSGHLSATPFGGIHWWWFLRFQVEIPKKFQFGITILAFVSMFFLDEWNITRQWLLNSDLNNWGLYESWLLILEIIKRSEARVQVKMIDLPS
jgi:hypothetical protein